MKLEPQILRVSGTGRDFRRSEHRNVWRGDWTAPHTARYAVWCGNAKFEGRTKGVEVARALDVRVLDVRWRVGRRRLWRRRYAA